MSNPERTTEPTIPESATIVEPAGTAMPEPDPEIVTRLWELTQHNHAREMAYGSIENELDMLYKDIEAGLFGESAKTGSFYLHVKSVKDANPKVTDERKAQLETELETLFANTAEASTP